MKLEAGHMILIGLALVLYPIKVIGTILIILGLVIGLESRKNAKKEQS